MDKRNPGAVNNTQAGNDRQEKREAEPRWPALLALVVIGGLERALPPAARL